jgi:hypothetical protein
MLTLGATRLLGGLTLPTLLQLQAQAATTFAPKAKACIFFLLEGGPSHIDMWDMKPEAPKEIRGPFNPISTVVPGTQISQLMPMCAQIADKYTILRSHSHADNAHQTGRHWLMTGYPPSFADGQAKGVPFNELYPSVGSIVSRELGPGGEVPPYIELPNPLGPSTMIRRSRILRSRIWTLRRLCRLNGLLVVERCWPRRRRWERPAHRHQGLLRS